MSVTELRLVLFANALVPMMEVTEEGIVTEVRRLLLNAYSPMEVTEEGIVTEVSWLSWNAPKLSYIIVVIVVPGGPGGGG